MKRLTKERENQIKEVLKQFPTVQAEKRADVHGFPELVDMKPAIKELLEEIESLRGENDKITGRHNGLFQQLGQTGCDLENRTKERDTLKEALKVAKETLDNTHKHLESVGDNPVASEHKSWLKEAIDKIKGLEKK